MNIFLIASAIVAAMTIAIARKRQEKIRKDTEDSFWERERQSNCVRRKPLDSLDLIQVPLDRLPMKTMAQEPRVAEYQELIRHLATQPIVNFTGYTNTDLKLEYGTANITLLSEYDQNYTLLVRTLQQWADALMEEGHVNDACVIMEFALSTGTDVSSTYYQLAELYAARGQLSQVQELIHRAEELHSSQKKTIVRTLQERYFTP